MPRHIVSYTELAHRVVRESPEPLPFAEIVARVGAITPIATKDPKATIRGAVTASWMIVATGDGRYGWKPRLITGSVLRLPLDEPALVRSELTYTEEARDALYPAFFAGPTYGDRSPVTVALPDGTQTTLSLDHLVERTWGTVLTPEVRGWLAAERAAAGDDLILTAVDAEARRYALALQRRAERDEAAIAARNAAVGEVALALAFQRNVAQPIWYITSRLLAQGLYHHPVPPEPLDRLLALDGFGIVIGDRTELAELAERTGEAITSLPVASKPKSRSKREPSQIYRLKITLAGSKPPIWRRVEVPGDFTLAQLHGVIQVAMGWDDYHLHQFEFGRITYGVPDPDDFYEVRDERKARLSQIASRPKAKFTYEYDFGDSWDHTILVEQVAAPEPGVAYPRCTAGRRACPPEDCGGIWGYASFLEALADPEHPEHDRLLEWAGGEFDPELFDIETVNRGLRELG